VCVKGATVAETLAGGRLYQPLYRPSLEEPFTPISWDGALDRIVEQIRRALASMGPGPSPCMDPVNFTARIITLPRNCSKAPLAPTISMPIPASA
jgi:anaerobic selenocysteine-containing dehydrogenase